jgi:hypothetical protein
MNWQPFIRRHLKVEQDHVERLGSGVPKLKRRLAVLRLVELELLGGKR